VCFLVVYEFCCLVK